MKYTITVPGYQERVLFLGANGSGKTILASRMIASYPRVVILDIKGDFPVPLEWRRDDYVTVDKPMGIAWHRNRILYRPKQEYCNSSYLNSFLVSMFKRAKSEGKKRPFILYLDEGLYVSAQGCKNAIASLAVTGRSIGLGLWVTAQRPRNIPVEVRTEAWRTYVFYLSYREDEMELIKYSKGRLTVDELEHSAVDYSFYELKRGKGGKMEVRHYPSISMNGDN